MADYYTLLTNAGIAYETACKAAGVPIKLSQISVGDGGGEVYNPAATATALKREVWRGPLNALFQDEKNPSWLLAEVTIPPEVGGWYVREAGLWTDTGILYAIVKYPESFKPVLATSGSGKEFYIRSIFETSNASLVTLLIDDTVVKATRAWVMGYLADELAKLDGKQSVRVVAAENIVLSGAQQIDGVAVVSGQRVLVAGQTAAKDNGIYVAANGAWVRAVDANSSAKVTPGLTVMVEEGSANGGSLWRLVTNGPITLGTTALSFEMLAGRTGIQAGTYKSLTVDKYGRAIAGANPETLAGFGIKDTYTKPEIESMIAQASALPVGTMVAFPVNKLAPGFLELDGSVQSIAVYPDLAAYLGTTFNKGDEGAGNFRLPESRAEFLRGWDHGRGVDAGRGIGTLQGSMLEAHSHKYFDNAGAALDPGGGTAGVTINGAPTLIAGSYTSTSGADNYATLGANTTVNAGGTETRPRSLAVMWCIKAWNAPINQGNIDIAALVALAALATETNQGTAKVATQTQVNEGTDDATIVTPKKLRRGFAINLATNGYVALPTWLGGLIIQWGNVNGATYNTVNGFLQTPITWPIAFPTAVLATSTSIVTGIAGNAFVNTSLELRTKVGGTWIYSSGVVGNTPILSYIAIGY
ncbi:MULTISPECIES: phage tail protein [unclassified Pseudomonas]|uniref:phage tail-collar fiber domain-containing protein n=1 Tax=unclassified Pseudomonas TaxID=196821 RepID=UPI000CD1E880|nr:MULTISPECIES: phage tail protein [unclassified Pseudomonas]POA33050.1 phage tail protein [Pseudomonas sp. GW456-R21]POA69558.1 phage tail protein [Pseudomonas sp. GW460-R15]